MKNYDIKFEYKQYSEKAILIQTYAKVDENLLNLLIFYKKSIEEFYGKVIIEVILTYNSLLILYVSTIENIYDRFFELKSLYSDDFLKESQKKRLWTIPVCYDKNVCPEIISFADRKSMSVDEIISLHTTPLYTIHFIGFLPGFLYLSGLDEKLITPRKSNPSRLVQQGSVAIGGNQTGIYPSDSPGGWHVIGSTPVSFFDVNSDPCCFAKPGDQLKFISINEKVYVDISLNISKDNFQLIPEYL
ncbi:5-oxoprolinase subunit PxpB [Aquimarina litoralis]|uniref:5-oxoprolinase subunit PxpB n=1 Tax=Aquimarina litoralis TaxID=584605 RepID=UPI001C57A974|nr:5-oxoprolinase subunit PxpB [Aquimarina litoralis]MBW1297375.1 5-oxoprolinase subunit PxpB [Aquimarina litoralis]